MKNSIFLIALLAVALICGSGCAVCHALVDLVKQGAKGQGGE